MAEKKTTADLASLESALQATVDQAEKAKAGPARDEEGGARIRVARDAKSAARRAGKAFAGLWTEMFTAAFRDKDPAARRMALLFFVGIAGVIVASTLAYRRYVRLQDLRALKGAGIEETSKNLGEFIQKQAEHAKKKFATLPMGKFTVDLKPLEGAPKAKKGVLGVAELELTIECDNKETRYYIEDNMTRARDQITGVLVSLDRDDLLTREGKLKLKKRILDHLNAWLPQGKVEELFISNQLLN